MALSLRLLGLIAWERCNFVVAYTRTEKSLALFREVGDKEGTAWALNNLAKIVSQQGKYARAISLEEKSLALFNELGNIEGIAFSLIELAWVLFLSEGDPAKVHMLLEEGLTLCREVGHKDGLVFGLRVLGEVSLQQGDAATARSQIEESMEIAREIGYRLGTYESLFVSGRVEALEGDYAAAHARYEESLAIGSEVGENLNITFNLEGLADVATVQGEPTWAARLLGSAEALREAMGTPVPPVYRPDYERSVAAARAQLGEKSCAAAWAEGRTMTPEQALASEDQLILPTPTSPARPAAAYPDGLTPREVDVLVLLAQGLTSAHIAEQLIIGVVTVNFHVRSIYSKLGVTSRSAATRYALEHHLV